MKGVLRLPHEKVGVCCAAIDLLSILLTLSLFWPIDRFAAPSIGYSSVSTLWSQLAGAVCVFYLLGGYRGHNTFIQTALRFVAFFSIAVVLGSFVPNELVAPRTLPILVGAVALAPAMSWGLESVLLPPVSALSALFKKRIMLVGDSREIPHLTRLANTHLGGSIEIVRVVGLASAARGHDDEALASAACDIADAAARCGASLIVLAGMDSVSTLTELAIELKCRGHEVCDIQLLLRHETGTIEPRASYEARIALEPWPKCSWMTRFVKRAQDMCLAACILVLTAPVLAVVALGVKLTSRGPILYRQIRIGLHSKPFEILKFRSMHIDAERDGNPRWAAVNDHRLTPIGRILRTAHLDELPQLINILRGDMSFVGPRPERPVFVVELASRIPCYRLRHMAKPGLTGWAQINYPYAATIEETRKKLAYDLYYLEHAGFFFDLFILARTARVVALGRGAR
jgi:exopolysaccharide biosynthesis polyprenyl glycosylphosphotransferase